MIEDGGKGRTIKTANRLIDIFETLKEVKRASLTDLSNHLNMPTSTLHAYLSTLVKQGYLIKDENLYELSLEFFHYGSIVKRNNPLYVHSEKILEQLAKQTGEMGWLAVYENGRGIMLRKSRGELAVQPYGEVGGKISLHDNAAGKAILSQFSDEKIRRIVDQYGLPARTENTITDFEELIDELEEVRNDRVAFNDCESIKRFRAVASPVETEEKRAGAIVVAGPKNRMTGDKFWTEYPELISGAANALELKVESE
jgi:DNA-binding IclR family transcriptional regulator